MTRAFYPVILAGGSGERFWPLSRKNKPKQFLSLDGSGKSLLQATAERLADPVYQLERVHVVTGSEYRAQVLDQLPELPAENLIVEPIGRDTAPAVLYAALRIAREDPTAVMGVFASDHRIGDLDLFRRVILRAREAAENFGSLVTLGITPTFPSTGYGYVQRGELALDGDIPIYSASRFVEKPNRATAETYLESGLYSWNSGMFVWTVEAILEAFRAYQPVLYDTLADAVQERGGVKKVFPHLQKISIDYAILEQAQNVQVIPAQFDWDDLGDWNALERLLGGTAANVTVGRHLGLDTDGAILYTSNGNGLVATIGLEDVVVVQTPEVTLVVRKDRTQDIKKVVQQLKAHPELERFV
ncbi:mannose-1-phosphate guanylyltransferase [Deinococcus yavapaiensis]|uniref:mannose-1-phosphate guanylyltransferase n=1 Tax=Deinococcus yavapaiensis KR-236 TaxID=694435 RepID=A0A318SDP2_9DEIO|nr:mannose-1-phosphate guanylyltransferase [Deinococcus yavapaiensis]PYE55658.1 mannose-1-phosphate guanylyltransferase (GDP) /mannose-6-phosphate isomerase type 2 [Deinococcus yavapaiensis KR-236]